MKALRRSWQIVLVATAADTECLPAALIALRSQSLSDNILVLSEDDVRLRSLLDELAVDAVYALPSPVPRGAFWTTLLQHFSPPEEACVFLRASVSVPEHWDARLIAAGQRAPSAVAVAPLCARHPLLTVSTRRSQAPGIGVDAMDQWVSDYAVGKAFPIPVMPPNCMLLQGDYWRNAGVMPASDEALAVQIRRSGHSIVATDQLYVDDSRLDYDDGTAHLPQPLLDAYLQRTPLLTMRHALSQLAERRESPPVLKHCRPVQLHVGHSWGGGLARWMEDYLAADTRHNHLVLRSLGDLSAFGQSIALYRGAAMDVPVETWTLCEPILSVSPGSIEYREILQQIIAHYSVESLVVSSFIGHSLDLLATGLPTTVVMHEFFPFCPALYAMYESPCHACTRDRLISCAANNPYNSFFKFEDAEHWLSVRRLFAEAVAQENVVLVAPSQSLVSRYRDLEPRLADKPVHVVAHGLNAHLAEALRAGGRSGAAPTASGERLRIVTLGRLTQEKGGDVLAEACAAITEFADLWLLGTGESGTRFASFPAVTVVPQYASRELGHLLREISPDVGLQLSTVPESFSYTLSELWAAGVPVLATPVGALRERVEGSGQGWLVAPDARALTQELRILHEDRAKLEAAASRLVDAEVRLASEMVDEYAALEVSTAWIPLARYFLPRRSYSNPYAPGSLPANVQALHINPQRPYRQALEEFLLHTAAKADQTPSLPRWARRLLHRALRAGARLVAVKNRQES